MKALLIQIKREFWEYQTSFIIIPLMIAALIIIAGIYIVTFHASLDSRIGMVFFNHVYQLESVNKKGEDVDHPGGGDATSAGNSDKPVEYTIDFTRGELIPAPASDSNARSRNVRQSVNAALCGIHYFCMVAIGLVLLFYLLSCLHGDRKDRSILFWKSMPVSETRIVAVKLIVATLAVPLLVTLISWGTQICFLLLSSIFVYRVGFNPVESVWSHVSILPVFFEQLKYFLWTMFWWLPLNAWLLFSSALGKRSPFLIATIPFVSVILMEKLIFGTWNIGRIMFMHVAASQHQMVNIMGESPDLINPGTIDFFLDNPTMIMGFVIAGLLFPATVWLRNHRFEI